MNERTNIYYWKCDRVAAFHGTSDYTKNHALLLAELKGELVRQFGERLTDLAVAPCGQGNHRTFFATLDGRRVFLRTEDGIEHDNYFAVESVATRAVAACGVGVPETIAYDCSRTRVSFSWQIIPFVPCKDLNVFVKAGTLDWTSVAPQIGRAIATWQEISPDGFGPFGIQIARDHGTLKGLHPTFEAYYRLNLERHLRFLTDENFLTSNYAARILSAINAHRSYLKLERGVLVHKDLAVWNILGTENLAKCFIDWDDCISGDPMDDLSLMGVTSGRAEVQTIVAAYDKARGLTKDAPPRFWLSWLRNIIFKSVIRVGAGYFKKSSDTFFLIGGGGDGRSLEEMTREKIERALVALEKGADLDAI